MTRSVTPMVASAILTGTSMLVASMLVASVPAAAQTTQGGDVSDMASVLGNAILQAAAHATRDTVHVSPRIIRVDPVTHTATMQFRNSSASDTVIAHLSVQLTTPAPRINVLLSDSASSDSTRADITFPDSIAQQRSLVTWIQDMPKQIQLLPGETTTRTVHLAVPAHVTPGDYGAYLLVETSAFTDPSHGGKPQDTPDGKSVKIKGLTTQVKIDGVLPEVAVLIYHVSSP